MKYKEGGAKEKTYFVCVVAFLCLLCGLGWWWVQPEPIFFVDWRPENMG